MVYCKHCDKKIDIHNKIDMDIYLWRHLKEKHPKIFKEEENKFIDRMFHDNFKADNPESEIEMRYVSNM